MRRILWTGAAVAALMALTSPAASAETPTRSYFLGPGSVLWANFSENPDGSGYQIYVYGVAPCTPTYSDREYAANMPPGWDDAVSRVHDFNNCDTKLFLNRGALPGDTQTGWIDGTSAGKYVGPNWNDKASSYLLS